MYGKKLTKKDHVFTNKSLPLPHTEKVVVGGEDTMVKE